MAYAKLFFQVVRYKTLRCCVFAVIVVALFLNFYILLSMKDDNEIILRSSSHDRDSRVIIARDTLEIVWYSHTSSLQLGMSTRNKEAIKQGDNIIHGPSISTVSRNIHTDPTISHDCQLWCRRHMRSPYQLSAVLLVRVYRQDLAGLSSREMLQWLFYLRYAGFDHVFVYDAYVSKNESQYHVLLPLVQSGYVSYVDWSGHNPYTIKGTQVSAYQHCIDNYGKNLTWHMAIDIDEYPFSPNDTKPDFMQRFLRNFSVRNPLVSQITLQNYLFLGKPLDPQSYPLLIARLRRRTHKKANDLGKSVFRVAQVEKAEVHHNKMRDGKTIDCDNRVMRLNHYWGARLQKWGEDTPETLRLTEIDYSIKPIVDRLNRCSECFGTDSLYRKRWN